MVCHPPSARGNVSEEPAPSTERRRFLRKGQIDLILAIAAIFISAVSLVVAIRTEQSQRDTLAASTWPFLQRNISGGSDAGEDREMSVGISNDGVGPAKVRSVEVFFDGKPVTSTKDLLRKCCGYRDDVSHERQLPGGYEISVADNTVQRAGEQNLMIRITSSAQAREIPDRFRASLMRLSFRGCYCSVLDQCWTSDLSSTKTTEVAACPAPEHPFDPFGK